MQVVPSRLALRQHPLAGAWVGAGWEATMRLQQLQFPQMRPRFVRVELEHQGELGWAVTVYQADAKRYVTAGDSTVYDFQSWEEAVEVVAAVLDGIDAAG